MNRKSWLILSSVAVCFITLFFGARANAWTEFRSGNSGTVASGQTVDSTLYVGARSIDIAGTVNGDLFCGGQTVNISGTVKGDVICGAQTINISGNVEGNVRIGAQTVNLTGTVGHNATIAAQTINTDSKSQVGGDASFAGTDLNLNGTIGRDLVVAGNNITIDGVVTRDIKSAANNITLLSGAKVGGGIEYTSHNKIVIDQGATVGGKVTQNAPKEHTNWIHFGVFVNIVAIISTILLLITALIVTALFPRFVHNVSNQAVHRPWWVLLTGFLASFIAPIVFVLLMVTIIGIPLAILFLLFWLLIVLSSGLFTSYYVGRIVWRRQNNAILRVLVGGFILLILSLVPYLGPFVMIAAFWIGLGMILLELKDRYSKPVYTLK